ncbi:MAG: hypothetical protein WCG83_02575 [Candidatus Peregrinibacteria bacterium]
MEDRLKIQLPTDEAEELKNLLTTPASGLNFSYDRTHKLFIRNTRVGADVPAQDTDTAQEVSNPSDPTAPSETLRDIQELKERTLQLVLESGQNLGPVVGNRLIYRLNTAETREEIYAIQQSLIESVRFLALCGWNSVPQ